MAYPPISGFTSSKSLSLLPEYVCRMLITDSKLSSAHVYLRQPDAQPHGEWDKLPAALLMDAAQLVKANSIEGKSSASVWSAHSLLTGFREQEG